MCEAVWREVRGCGRMEHAAWCLDVVRKECCIGAGCVHVAWIRCNQVSAVIRCLLYSFHRRIDITV